jgi:uncharacterized repeat protein (TIGR01451 family)
MCKFYLFLVAGVLCCHVPCAQTIQNYTLPNAAGSANARLFVEHPDVWVGTYAGAYKFNGAGFEVVAAANGLLSNNVINIAKDVGGRMLFMHDKGLSIRELEGDVHSYRFPYSGVRSMYGGALTRIGDDIWYSYDFGVGLFRAHDMDTTHYQRVPNGQLSADAMYIDVAKAKDGTYYAIDSAALYSVNESNKTLDKVAGSFGFITSLLVDSNDAMYIVSGHGKAKVWVRRRGNTSFSVLSHDFLENVIISTIRQGKSGEVYFATSKGLVIYQSDGWSRIGELQGLPSDYVLDAAVDDVGNVWVSTASGLNNEIALSSIAYTTPPQDLDKVHGVVYYDVNRDGVRNEGEPGLPNQLIRSQPAEGYAITNANGEFFVRPRPGSNTISWVDKGEWTGGGGPVSYTFASPGDNQHFYEFGVVMGGPDIIVSLSSSAMRPGFNGNYWISVRNGGNTSTPSELTFDYSEGLQVTGSTPAASVTDGRVLHWTLPALEPGQTFDISLNFSVPVGTALETMIIATASVPVLPKEEEEGDNIATWTRPVTGSFDPNDKLVNEGILEARYVEMGTPLHYTIRFQNTGTDTAFHVKVVDNLDTRLDLTSLEILSTSHPTTVALEGRTLAFHFYDILLPDSTRDEPNSHGYIQYRISPVTSMADGTKVRNQASIYFDFNEPVVTNETVNTYVNELPSNNPTGVDEDLHAGVAMYPNPVRDGNLVIVSKNAEVMEGSVMLTSLAGSTMRAASLQGVRMLVDVKGVAPGMYVLKIDNRGMKSTQKVVILQE